MTESERLLLMSAKQLKARLCTAIEAADFIPFRHVRFRDGRSPQSHNCHENVAAWIEENPDDRPLRGWLVSDLLLDRHSIVLGKNGELFDITPLAFSVRFARHPGDENEFFNLPNQINLVALEEDITLNGVLPT